MFSPYFLVGNTWKLPEKFSKHDSLPYLHQILLRSGLMRRAGERASYDGSFFPILPCWKQMEKQVLTGNFFLKQNKSESQHWVLFDTSDTSQFKPQSICSFKSRRRRKRQCLNPRKDITDITKKWPNIQGIEVMPKTTPGHRIKVTRRLTEVRYRLDLRKWTIGKGLHELFWTHNDSGTLPESKIFAPENQWLVQMSFLFGFRGGEYCMFSFREGNKWELLCVVLPHSEVMKIWMK